MARGLRAVGQGVAPVTLRASLLRAVNAARAVPQSLGLRTIRVWVRSSIRTLPALLPGGTTSSTDVEMVPRPAVRELDTVDASYWGAEASGLVSGFAQSEIYAIGPITPDHVSGGYSWSDLRPLVTTTTDTTRFVLADAEAGGKLGTTPIEFELVQARGQDKDRSVRWMLLVRRCRPNATDG